jgi:hypothetical protein
MRTINSLSLFKVYKQGSNEAKKLTRAGQTVKVFRARFALAIVLGFF